MTDKFSRRSAVVLLGLATTASAAHTVEALGQTSDKNLGGYKFGRVKPEVIANALERLAADIRSGNSYAQSSTLLTKCEPEDFLIHEFTVTFMTKDLPKS